MATGDGAPRSFAKRSTDPIVSEVPSSSTRFVPFADRTLGLHPVMSYRTVMWIDDGVMWPFRVHMGWGCTSPLPGSTT